MFGKLIVIASLTLASSLLAAPPALTNAESRIAMLRALLTQQPWDKQRLQRIVAISLTHDYLRAKKPQDWEEKAQIIEADPDYVPNASQVFSYLILSLPFADRNVTKLLLWKMTDPHGKLHWLFGTLHTITFANFTNEARHQLTEVIDAATVILHENVPAGSIELAHALLDADGYAETIDKLVQLDVQVIARGIYRGKKIVALEDRHDRLAIQLNKAKLSPLLEEPSLLGDEQPIPMEKVAADIVASLELGLTIHTAYLTADVSAIQEVAADMGNHADTKERNHFWLDRIVTQCEQNAGCLIIAGHGHMTTDNKHTQSIITLLRERGFTIELVE